MLVTVNAAALQGIDAIRIEIETVVEPGFTITLVGMPDKAVKESIQRIESAISHSALELPRRKILINMAPAEVKKEGAAYDLPLAISMLAGDKRIPHEQLPHLMLMGELGLDGALRPIGGVLPMAILARKMGLKGFIVPKENATEAAVVNNLEVFGAATLREVVDHLTGVRPIAPTVVDTRGTFGREQGQFALDFSDVKGQESVKRAFEVACAGGHNILLVGPPGAGKSMMAKRLPSILPPLSLHEALETTKIHSVAGNLKGGANLISQRPFRSPHHTISNVALVGGGTNPMPGEISLAHNGILFLDEFPEFSRTALEVMRQPLEDRSITVARAKYTLDYPANFMLVASMNPCPCGYYTHPTNPCQCTQAQVQRYLGKISGPLLDRIDLQVEIMPVPFKELQEIQPGEPSAAIRERVIAARAIQQARFADTPGVHCNAQMTPKQLAQFARPTAEAMEILERAMVRYDMSARAYDRILKVARTIADLDGSGDITAVHMHEAVSYRNLDRSTWGLKI